MRGKVVYMDVGMIEVDRWSSADRDRDAERQR